MHNFSKISPTLKISHGLENRSNTEILMKLENFCVLSFLALFYERRYLLKEIVFYTGLMKLREEQVGFYQTNLCLIFYTR